MLLRKRRHRYIEGDGGYKEEGAELHEKSSPLERSFLLMRKYEMILLLGKVLSNIQRCRNKDDDTDGNVLCIGIHAQIL